MSGLVNLAPDTVVPKSGYYKCEFCGADGLADIAARMAKKQSLETNANFKNLSLQNSIKHFKEGDTFTQCPTCGPATGWTFIDDQEAAGGEQSGAKRDIQGCACDVCGDAVFSPDGFLLVTSQVVSEPAYWRHYYNHHKINFGSLGVTSFASFVANPMLRINCAKQIAELKTPWILCEKCMGLFGEDLRDKARLDAAIWWKSGRKYEPEGNGPAPLDKVNMGDGKTMFQAAGRPGPKPQADKPAPASGRQRPTTTRPGGTDVKGVLALTGIAMLAVFLAALAIKIVMGIF